MAVENDYNLLVQHLIWLDENIGRIRADVEQRLHQEKRDGLEPNATRWVQLLVQQLPVISGPSTQLEATASAVLRSRPGEAVSEAQPPSAPDAPP